MSTAERARRGRVAVLAPSPYVTVTVERAVSGADEVHFHVGGQGYWIARLAAELGADVTVCATLGGEAGAIVQHLFSREPLTVEAIATTSANGVYVHDRRSGVRKPVAVAPPAPLDRHGADDLYGATLAAAAGADVLALAGPTSPQLLPSGFFARLAADARRAGATVVADVSGAALDEVLGAGVDVLKISLGELRRDRLADEEHDVAAVAGRLHDQGARAVVVTREGAGSVVVEDGVVAHVVAPRVSPVEPAGAGDSMTGALVAVLARDQPLLDAVRVGTAAAALNVTRRGLGSGRRADIERFAERVEVRTVTRA